jgi:MYXO-CTERM domain-containing protein
VSNYATFRMGDVNGDGYADLCARSNSGISCHLGAVDGLTGGGATWREGLSDAAGWNAPRFFSTLRLADVNGDGRDDLCARDAEGFGCWSSDGAAFTTRIEGPRWSDASGWGVARHYGTIRMGDVNGDGRADVCARSAAGVDCWLSDGAGFPTRLEGPRWADDVGWGAMQYWSTIRMADVNGDGNADVCARSASDLRCVMSTGDGFGETWVVGAYSDESGWNDVSNYATLRVGDVNGDGADDLCLRGNAGMRCNLWNGEGFDVVEGPAWHDDDGWASDVYTHGIQLADVDGDRRMDVCARASSGWRCHLATDLVADDGTTRFGFGEGRVLEEFTNAGSWDTPAYRTTILIGGPRCMATTETCNGEDDDCDRVVDENAQNESCNGLDDDCDGAIDEHATTETCDGSDEDCDGMVDEGACGGGDAAVAVGRDGGPGVPGADGMSGAAIGGCGCAVPFGSSTPAPGLFALGLLGLLWRRSRRR